MAAKKPERLLINQPLSQHQFSCEILQGSSHPWHVLDTSFDSVAFLQFARENGVSSLIFDKLRNTPDWDSWPSEIRQALEQDSKNAVARELLRRHHLQRLLRRFSETGVQTLVTKGEALASTHYSVPGSRTRGDSDVLIPIDQIEAARRVAIDAGYEIFGFVYRKHQFTVWQGDERGASAQIDVHWRVLNNARYARAFSFEELYEESVGIDELCDARVPGPVEALILACMHRDGSDTHDKNRLIWIYDIHLLFKSMNSQQIRRFCRLASEKGVVPCCKNALETANEFFGTPVPDGVLMSLQSQHSRPVFKQRYRDSYLGLLVNDLLELPGWNGRKRLLKELIAPPSEVLMTRYGKQNRCWLPWLYFRQFLDGFTQKVMLR